MTKHAPAPWVISTDRIRVLSDENGPDYEIANCDGMSSGHPCPIEMQQANAQLIAAAPDLLDALDRAYLQILMFLDEGKFNRLVEFDAGYIVDAIAKARGES